MVSALKRLSRKGYVTNIPVLSELSESLKSSLKGISEFANAPSRVDMRSSTVFAPDTGINQSDKWYSSITGDFYDTQDEAILKEYDFKSSGAGKIAEQILDQPYLGQWTFSDDLSGRTVRSLANEFASKLNAQNITDLNQLGTRDGVLINKQTGEEVTGLSNIGRSTSINFAYDASGKPILYTQYIPEPKDNFFADIAPFLGIGLSFLAPGLGTAIGSALGATGTAASVLGNAVIGGTLSEASGGDFVKGALSAGAGSALGAATAPVTSAVSQAVGSDVLGRALTSGALAEAQGGDFLQGALRGGVSGAIDQAKLAAAEDYLRSFPAGYTQDMAPTEADVFLAMGQTPPVNIADFPVQDFGVSIDVNTPFYTQTGASAYVPNADGTTTYTWDDGSTITVDPSFNVVSYTNATDTAFVPSEQQPEDISKKLAALDAAKALAPLAVGALTAGALVNKISDGQTQTGFPIVPIPSDWRSPEYNMAFTPSAPINFGGPELLRGTQWENPINLSGLINTLNQPVIAPQTQQMMTQFQAPETPYETGITDIIGEIGGQPVSIADIISGIQSGQNYSS